jgi:hypothetical protein
MIRSTPVVGYRINTRGNQPFVVVQIEFMIATDTFSETRSGMPINQSIRGIVPQNDG